MRSTTEQVPSEGAAWLTPRQTAAHLRVGVDTIYAACAAGGLKHVKLGTAPSAAAENGLTDGQMNARRRSVEEGTWHDGLRAV
jgi:excisionase family DNA binding protein